MKVQELMTRQVRPIHASDSCGTAAECMWQADCGAVPVCDADDEKVIGMITDRDICMATWSRGKPPGSIAVSDAMSKTLVWCSSEDTVANAERLMRTHRIRRIPVIDAERHLLGMLSLADIATAANAGRFADSDLSAERVTSTLAGICGRLDASSVRPDGGGERRAVGA